MNILQTRLSLVFYGGLDAEGKDIFKTKSFSNINILATDVQLKNTAQALVTLQQYALEGVSRQNLYDLIG